MRRFLYALCVICFVCAVAFAQEAQTKQQSPQTVPSAQPKMTQNAPSGEGNVSDAKSSGKASSSNAPDDFVIGAEDVLEIKVWHEPDLTTRAVVRPDGKFGMSLLGDIQASGLTATQLKEQIAAKLDRFYEQPEVSVVVVEIHSQTVHLIGAVGRPGAYSLGGPLTVVELLARAGGLAETAKMDQISIIRQRGKGEIERIPFNYKEFLEGKNLHSNIQLKNGDVVVVR